jgi:hypothetical protein
MFTHSAFITAIFYIFPYLLPFFSPGKRPVAYNANLLRQKFFPYIFQDSVSIKI